MRTDLRRRALCGLAPALLLLGSATTACSGSSASSASTSRTPLASSRPGPSSPAASASPGASPSASPDLASASADEILAQAHSALLAAGTVHAKGTVRTGDTPYTLDLQMVRRLGAMGRVAEKGTALGVVRIKDVAYVQLDEASWRAVTGSTTTARQFAGKYLKVTSSNGDAFKPFLALTDLDQVFNTLLVPAGTVTKGAVSTIDGRRVIDLRIDGGRTGDVYVALDGPPYPVRLAYGRGGAQRVDLDGFGRKVALAAPPASKVAAA